MFMQQNLLRRLIICPQFIKSKVGELDVYKLKTVPVDLSKLSDVVDNDFVKKTAYDELVKKVNTTDSYRKKRLKILIK